ncbi:MAG: ATP-binding protein [Methanobrevibacter ruminantium]|uniref:AAA family ATPase n=1 Tax=Methanobrevibacter ruminantium TaxID=83816 RepID=UPI0026EE1350|nr:ATP-binding protein [Methanobrevibacter ruminantium]MDO5841966.1 ATP-binding protein [Methanobrevibacter ruminantium]
MASLPLGNDNDLDDSQFFNRVDEISFISDNLELAKKGSTPTILLTGIRGVGKTALMKKLKKDFQNEYLVVYMDLSAMDKFKKDKLDRFCFMRLFYESIIKACDESNIITIDAKILKYFKTRNFIMDKIESVGKIPIPILKTEEDYTKFTSFVMDLPQQIYDDCKEHISGILIFMDEFQILKQLDEDVNGFLWYIRSVIQSQKNIGYIFSGSMSVKDELISDIAGQKGAFGGRILNYEIKTFSYETTKDYLTEKADYLEFTDDGFKRFYKCTNGIPYYINSFARLLPPNEELNEEKIISEFKKSLPYLLVHLTNEWYKLTKQEQRIIVALVEEPLRRIDIANKLGVKSGAIGASLKTLQNKILIELNNEKYQIYDSIFKAWLKKEYEEKGDYPY